MFAAKVVPAAAAFPLGKVTTVAPPSDSAGNVQLVHFAPSRAIALAYARALRAQL
jgi:hypothetical protein